MLYKKPETLPRLLSKAFQGVSCANASMLAPVAWKNADAVESLCEVSEAINWW